MRIKNYQQLKANPPDLFPPQIVRFYGRIIPGEMIALDDGRVENVPFNVHTTLEVGRRGCVEYVGKRWYVGHAGPF